MYSTRNLFLLAAAILGTACGGSSSAPAPVSPLPDPPPPASQAPGGLWYGTLTNDMNLVTEEFIALTTDDGRMRLISVDSDVQFHGPVAVTGNTLGGTVRAFADAGVNWLDGNHVVDTGIAATVAQRDSLAGSWQNSSGEAGSFEFFYDALHEKDSDTALLDGVWTAYDDFGNPVLTFTIDANGGFTGQNLLGCTSIGQLSVVDAAFNVYEIQSEISNCPLAGSYSGLAFLADLAGLNDALLLSIDDGTRTIVTGLTR